MLVLTQAAEFGFDLETRLAALVHDFGKGVTPRNKLPKHYGHDVAGVPVVEQFCNRVSVPAKMRDRLKKVTRFHMNMHRLNELNNKTFVNMFMTMDAFRDRDVVVLLANLGKCDERGRLGYEQSPVDHLDQVVELFDAAASVKFADVFPDGETNPNKIKEGLFKSRVNAVRSVR